MTAVDPIIDPALLDRPSLRAALAVRDIATAYRLLIEAGVPQRAIATAVGQSQSEVSEIVAGRQVRAVPVLERIAEGLGVPRGWLGLAYDDGTRSAYADTVMVADPHEGVDEAMRRRAFLAAASVALWGRPVLGELLELPTRPESPTPVPSRLGMADVDALRALTERMRMLARQFGGQGDTVGSIANRSTARLLPVDARDDVKLALGSALADLHTVAGWCCFDSGSPEGTRHHFTRGLELATESGDTYRAVNAIYHAGMAMQHAAPDEALKLFQLARFRITQGSDHPRARTLTAWLHADSARSLAVMDRPADARSELAAARDGWYPADRFDQADMDHVTAQAHVDLGMLDSAEPLAATSVGTWEERERRDAAQAGITLATLHVRTAESDGPRLAEQAISGVAGLRSQRARSALAPLADALEARGGESRELAAHARRVAAVPA